MLWGCLIYLKGCLVEGLVDVVRAKRIFSSKVFFLIFFFFVDEERMREGHKSLDRVEERLSLKVFVKKEPKTE